MQNNMLKKVTFDIQKCTRSYVSDEYIEGQRARKIQVWLYFVNQSILLFSEPFTKEK